MRVKILIALLATLLMLLVVTPLLGQPSDISGAEQLKTLLQKRVAKVEEWRSDAFVILMLTLAVGFLGIASGALQLGSSKWVKPTTVAVGITISVLTLVQSEVYKLDRWTLKRAATRAERIIEDVQLVLPQAEFVETREDWEVFAELINEKIDRIDVIEDRLEGFDQPGAGDVVASRFPDLIASAEAAVMEGRPEWVERPPTSRSAFFFVGHALDPSLGRAKEGSQADAVEQAVSYFINVTEEARGASRFDAEVLSKRIVDSAEVESTYYAFSREHGGWRFYTLLRVARSAADRSIEYYSIEQQQAVPESVAREVRRAPAPKTGYTERRFEMQQEMIASAEVGVPPEIFERFEVARELRRAGDSGSAVAILRSVVEESPDFYMAWHNLALGLDDLERFEDAAAAYERTVELERAAGMGDASLYNSYGYLLYRMGRYEDAVPLFEHAVELAPDHLRAGNNLRAARAMARDPR